MSVIVRIYPALGAGIFLSALATGLLAPVSAWAQYQEDQQATERVIEQLSSQYNIPRSSKYFAKFQLTEESKRLERESQEWKRPALSSADGRPFKVVRHYRGTSGSIFTPPPEAPLNNGVVSSSNQEIMAITKQVPEMLLAVMPRPQLLERCSRSETEKTKLPVQKKRDPTATRTMFDYLFIRKGEVPTHPEESIGSTVSIQEYEDVDDTVAYLAMGFGAPCLPYRIRATHQKIYRHFGADALKNYEKSVEHGR